VDAQCRHAEVCALSSALLATEVKFSTQHVYILRGGGPSFVRPCRFVFDLRRPTTLAAGALTGRAMMSSDESMYVVVTQWSLTGQLVGRTQCPGHSSVERTRPL